jgi:two-component sensor histidine kinase
MKLLPRYLNWLASAEDVLPEKYIEGSLPNIDPLLERILWHLTSSFFTGPFTDSEGSSPNYESTIQYFSFPLFSHYKEIQEEPPFWISRYPIYFGNRDEQQLSRILAQYAFLYRWLTEKNSSHFSLTSFAGNLKSGLSHPPRYMLLDLSEAPTAKRASMKITSSSQVFALVGRMLPAPDISSKLFSIQHDVKRMFDKRKNYPIIGGNFNANNAADFWKSFDKIVNACSDLKGAIRETEDYAKHVEAAFLHKFEGDIDLRDNSKEIKEEAAGGLARFVAWNYVLGFRKIIYCPYRIAEPSKEGGQSHLVSWGGGILVLSDSAPLSKILEYVTVDPEHDHHDSDKLDDSLWRSILGIRFFVDVATPKVIFSDWKYFQRTLERNTINKLHAKGISAGLSHELAILKNTVISHIEGSLGDDIAIDLDVSRDISQLVWEAYSEADKQITLADLSKRLCEILRWGTLDLKFKGITANTVRVEAPIPLLYVLAELCRNAFKFSVGNPSTTTRKVEVNFTIAQTDLVSVRVLNKTQYKPPRIICENRREGEPLKKLGLNLVMNIVCDLLGGKFSFEVVRNQATASVLLKPRKTTNERSQRSTKGVSNRKRTSHTL